jgi:hypothetical protein
MKNNKPSKALVKRHHPDCLHVYPTGDIDFMCVDDCQVKSRPPKNGIQKVETFLRAAKKRGYEIRGSVFKVDFNGTIYNVGFWISPRNFIACKYCKGVGHVSSVEIGPKSRCVPCNGVGGAYKLPGISEKVRHEDFDTAVDLLIKKCRRG